MSTDSTATTEYGTEFDYAPWRVAILGGVLGGLFFGVIMTSQTPGVIETSIPQGLYGLSESMTVGWLIHLSHGAFLGVVFAGIVTLTGLDERLTDLPRTVGTGLVYGLVLWAVLAAVVMPIWVSGGSTANVPAIAIESIAGHSIYGITLGLAHWGLTA